MTAPVKTEKPIIPPDKIEREKIVEGGRAARVSGMPGCLNPYRDPDRRAAWDLGYGNDNPLGNSTHT